ncbi:MAG: nucleotidyltransferase [Myxococcales bacterium]|nr:nucleotidyltransferase [Myxococcales bacterium]
MLPINQAFDAFVRALQPNKARAAQAERMQSHVRATLRHHLPSLRESFLTGSFARSTAIEPLADVDVFLVLDPRLATRATAPKELLRSVQTAVKKAMPGDAVAALQNHSIGLTYAGNDLRLDLVPALPEGEHYWIPDIPRGNWIRTSPRRQKALLDAADHRAGSKLRPLIRLAKAARRKGFGKLGSYHLEVMSLTAFASPPPDYARGFAMLLAHLGDKVIQHIQDPTGGDGPRLSLPLAERQDLQRRLNAATATAERALHLGATGALDKAHAQWRHLFGDGWPG